MNAPVALWGAKALSRHWNKRWGGYCSHKSQVPRKKVKLVMYSVPGIHSITRLHRYYEAIRFPGSHLPSSLFSCSAYSLCSERNSGPPGLPCIHNVRHAMVSDPEETVITLPLAVIPVLTSTFITVWSFPTRKFRGSIPSTLWLTAYLLAVLRLKLYVTIEPPKTCYPVAG